MRGASRPSCPRLLGHRLSSCPCIDVVKSLRLLGKLVGQQLKMAERAVEGLWVVGRGGEVDRTLKRCSCGTSCTFGG